MDYYRLFIDLPIEPTVAKNLYRQFSQLPLPWPKLKTVAPSHCHLTLKFLGDTPLDNLPQIISVLDTVPAQIKLKDLEISLAGPAVLKPERPRALVLMLKANSGLEILQQSLDKALAAAGLATPEHRRFLPHITLARGKQNIRPEELETFSKWRPTSLNFSASYFELQDSVLTPRGPQYTVLQTFPL